MKVSQKLVDAGFTNIVNVEEGTSAWHAAGTDRGRFAGSDRSRGRAVCTSGRDWSLPG
jgi:hypothetical protein